MLEIYLRTDKLLKRNEAASKAFISETEKRQKESVRQTLNEILTTGNSETLGNLLNDYERLLAINPKELSQSDKDLQSQINNKLAFNFGSAGAEFIVREWIQRPTLNPQSK